MLFFSSDCRSFCRALIVPVGLLALIITTGCGASNSPMLQPEGGPSVVEAAANVAAGGSVPKVLLFVGTGTTAGSVAGYKAILGDLKLTYATATSSQLNGMSQSALKAYKLLIVPGGNAITISRSLTSAARANVKNAITGGLHYLGVCAGAFFAGHSGVYNYLDLTPAGVWFNFYADEFKGITKAALEITAPDGSRLDQYWQNGPQLSGWGSIVGKYPDGTPAIVEGKFGSGWAILCAVHPEATQAWRTGMTFTTPVAVDNAYAEKLVTNALNGTSLPHF